MSRQLSLRFFIPSTSRNIVSRSVTHDLSQPNQNQNNFEDNDDANSPVAATTQARISDNFKSSDCSQSNQVEDSNSEEETDQDVHTPTVVNTDQSMLSVRVHTKPPSDLASVPTKSPTQPKINFPSRKFGMGRPRGLMEIGTKAIIG